ncbi:EB domain-containing protein [Nephila pilipes]|uniref:EB domain-containing protein n=1 Tax=Nephila pilipes TaxID=299642 RepID=A0A8X6U9S3_NEPPI|nr:EB domain-containing protein [Nephila pilipes]
MNITACQGLNCFWPFLLLVLNSDGLFKSDKEDIMQNITCTTMTDCTHINGSICSDELCTCPYTTPIFVNSIVNNEGYCLPSLNLTEGNCSFNQQCNYDHGFCMNGKCTCAEKYHEVYGVCQKEEKSALIPIIAGSVIGATIVITLISYYCMSRRREKS